jgi:hypothetical protein
VLQPPTAPWRPPPRPGRTAAAPGSSPARPPHPFFLILLLAPGIGRAIPPADFYWLDGDPWFEDCLVYDGQTDANLQSALATVSLNGGTLVFPPGRTCYHYGELLIQNGNHFIVEGNGSTLKDVATLGGPLPELWQAGLRIVNSHNFEIRNLTFDGNRSQRPPTPIPEPPAHLILVRASTNIAFINVQANNAVVDGFYFKGWKPPDPIQEVENVRLIGCTADNNYRTGLSLILTRNFQVIGGTYSNTQGIAPEVGINLETNTVDETIFDSFR